ncbi:MAG: 1-hydroxycarotenoid 3,4-desaturase CrtD [Pseudomonadota bacterium]
MTHIAIIGTGIGGLTAGMALAHAGHQVTFIERASRVGGKMRTFESAAGPVDAGPTVLTLRHVFEAAFQNAGTRLEDHVDLHQAAITARHFWQDAPVLDFLNDQDATVEAVTKWGGPTAREDFIAFRDDASRLFDAFDQPMMYATEPSFAAVTQKTLSNRKLFQLLSKGDTMERYLKKRFREPKLAQLFGRYATYVGGMPGDVPMVLSLIAKSESDGVWAVKGGMHALARAMAQVAQERGAEIVLNTHVEAIVPKQGGFDVVTSTETIVANRVLFNGDPAALFQGALGSDGKRAVSQKAVSPRSLSAHVWAFSAEATGCDLSHHNVFFANEPNSEFRAIREGKRPADPTLYVCAQDRGFGVPTGPERFEIIMNAAPTNLRRPTEEEKPSCAEICFKRLQALGLTFTPRPDMSSQTGPAEFAALFPHSDGSLYGRSPSGMMAPFQRTTARTKIKGLYLCGGGVHPGPGVPMASLSGQHAAAAIMRDLTSTSRFRQMATRGGISTA